MAEYTRLFQQYIHTILRNWKNYSILIIIHNTEKIKKNQRETRYRYTCILTLIYGYNKFYLPWLYSPCGSWPLFQFLNLYTVGRTSGTGDEPVARPLPIHRTIQTQNKWTQTCMFWVGFEPTIPVFKRAKTVHALYPAATVTGYNIFCSLK
jgi:hypothetical protein